MKRRPHAAIALGLILPLGSLAACGNDPEPLPRDQPAATSTTQGDPGRPATIKPIANMRIATSEAPDSETRDIWFPKPEVQTPEYAPGALAVLGIDHDSRLGSNAAQLPSEIKATCWGTRENLRAEVVGPKGWKGTIRPGEAGSGYIEVENPSAGYSPSTLIGDALSVSALKDTIKAGKPENTYPLNGIAIKDNNDVRVEMIVTQATSISADPVAADKRGQFPLDWAPTGSAGDTRRKEGPRVTFAVFLNLSCGR